MPDTLYNRDYNPSGFAVYDVRIRIYAAVVER